MWVSMIAGALLVTTCTLFKKAAITKLRAALMQRLVYCWTYNLIRFTERYVPKIPSRT